MKRTINPLNKVDSIKIKDATLMENSVDDTAIVEGQKLAYDGFKHLTTLSTGLIILLAAFLKDLFSNPVYKWLVPLVFLFFILSMVGSVIMMFTLAYTVGDNGEIKRKKTTTIAIVGFITSWLFFIVGITLFVIFVLFNFYK